MPSVLTHYLFYKTVTNNNEDIGIVGTQGPDPFFFYGHAVRMTKRAKELRAFGTFLHKQDPAVTFKYILEYILGSKKSEQPILINYTKGMLAHYILDRNCHPYIFYKSGFVTDEDKDTFKYFKNHANIESGIDVLLMDHFKNTTRTYEAIRFNKHDLKVVSKMIYSLGKGCYKNKYIKENSFYKATKSMKFVNKVLFDKDGKKKECIDKKLGFTPASPMCQPQLKDIKLDFLNLNHESWKDCVTNENERKDDFYALFNNALEEYKKYVAIFNKVLEGKEKPSIVNTLFDEIDHNGFKVGAKMKYFDSFYK